MTDRDPVSATATPRTDAALTDGRGASYNAIVMRCESMIALARQLERELADAKAVALALLDERGARSSTRDSSAVVAALVELENAIDDAPHAEYCGAPSSRGAEVYQCRCWKNNVERILSTLKGSPATVPTTGASEPILMEIAHIVMGFRNEDETAHVRMLAEIENIIARSDTPSTQQDSIDATRYRWLQGRGCGNAYGKVGTDEDCYLQLNPRDMDAAIDSALASAIAPQGGKDG